MAVSRRACVFALLTTGSVAWSSGACRSIEVCPGAECAGAELQAGGAETAGGQGADSATLSSGMPGQQLAGEAGVGGQAVAGAESEPGLVCALETADCDGSRLTGCEASLTWNVRDCGGCGQLCTGLCLAGECQESVLVQPVFVGTMVATGVTGYAIASANDYDSLLKIDLATGTASSLFQDLGWPAELALSGDRVYVHDTSTHAVRSLALDGSNPTTEAIESPDSIGGTTLGAYYVDYVWHEEAPEEDQYEYRLFFRATGSSTWELLRSHTRPLHIFSSTAAGMVLGSYADDDSEDVDAELSIWKGKNFELLSERPKAWRTIKVVADGTAVMLASDDETGEPCLWWKKTGDNPAKQYPLGVPWRDVGDDMLVRNDNVALHFETNGRAYVQLFDVTGAELGRLGVPTASQPLWLAERHLWHSVADTWITFRFLRSQSLPLDI